MSGHRYKVKCTAILIMKTLFKSNSCAYKNRVDKNDSDFVAKVRYAIDNDLHHYHIGIPSYTQSPTGNMTSEYILHYVCVNDDEIRIVDMDRHPPFKMPNEKYLASTPKNLIS